MSIAICIGNYGYYNEGELRDSWLTLPIDPDGLMPWLKERGLYDETHEEIYISDYDEVPFGLERLFNEFSDIRMLNLLACQMDSLSSGDEERLEAYLDCEDEPATVLELMNLIEQVDDLPVYGYSFDFAYAKDNWGTLWVDRNDPEENLGYEFLQYNAELVKAFENDSDAEAAFDVKAYGERIEDSGLRAYQHVYVDTCADAPDLEEFDAEYFADEYAA